MKLKQLLTSSGFLLQAQLEIRFTEDQRQSFRNKHRWKKHGRSSGGTFWKGRNAKVQHNTFLFDSKLC